MSRISILLFCIISLISCTTNKSNKNALDQKGVPQDIINNIDPTQTTDTISKPEVLIKYKSPVNGYNVVVEWLGAEIIDEYLAFGDVLIHFKKNDGTGFTVHNIAYWDEGLKVSDIEPMCNKTIELEYIPKNDKYLATRSPFFFADMDFDEQDELVIVGWKGGRQYAHLYDVYEISDSSAHKKTTPPFDTIELGISKFDPKKKQIIHSYVNLFRAEEYVYQKVETPSPEADISPGEKFILQEVIRTEF
jgi:hypothetical protein